MVFLLDDDVFFLLCIDNSREYGEDNVTHLSENTDEQYFKVISLRWLNEFGHIVCSNNSDANLFWYLLI